MYKMCYEYCKYIIYVTFIYYIDKISKMMKLIKLMFASRLVFSAAMHLFENSIYT
jgi:hypothetical protein